MTPSDYPRWPNKAQRHRGPLWATQVDPMKSNVAKDVCKLSKLIHTSAASITNSFNPTKSDVAKDIFRLYELTQ